MQLSVNVTLPYIKKIAVEYQCGKTTSENGTYFTSPATPQRICNLLINRVNDDICQVNITHTSLFTLTGFPMSKCIFFFIIDSFDTFGKYFVQGNLLQCKLDFKKIDLGKDFVQFKF